MIPRPGPDKTPVPKVSLVTRVGDPGLRCRLLQVEPKRLPARIGILADLQLPALAMMTLSSRPSTRL